MPRKLSEEKLNRIHEESMTLLNSAQSAYWQERLQCLQDRRFLVVDGAMWEDLATQFENKPRFTVNKLMAAVDRILAEMKRNPVSVKFVAKDGEDANDFAQIASSLFRADEQDSFASEAYENAAADAVIGGFGAFRLVTEYENEFDEDSPQRIRFENIPDADSSVFFDLSAKRKDKSDAKHCWVILSMPRAEWEAEYPDRDVSSVQQRVHQWEFDWFTPEVVRIVEHYRVETIKDTVQTWVHVSGAEEYYHEEDFENDDQLLKTLKAEGWKKKSERTTKTRAIHKFLEDGLGIIEDLGIIAGKYIPIVPMYGKRFFIDNVERCQGAVRLAKDVQRLLNMELSKLADIAGSNSNSKPIFAPEQIEKWKGMWENDGVVNYPYLVAEPLRNIDGTIAQVGPIGMTQAPAIPEALSAIYAQTQNDIKDVMGMDAEAVTVQSNVSGEAVKLIIDQLNLFTLGYMQNRADAIRHAGVIWMSMAPNVYVEAERKMKMVSPDGASSSTTINKPTLKDGVASDTALTFGKQQFDVVATTEPAMVSKKAELTRSLMGLLQYTKDPQVSSVIQLEILKNAEGSELSGIQKWARSQLVQRGVEQPTPAEQQQLQAAQGQPKPQDVALAAYAKRQEAEAALAGAQIEKTKSEVQKNNATVAQIIGEIQNTSKMLDSKSREQLVAEIQQLHSMMMDVLPMAQGQDPNAPQGAPQDPRAQAPGQAPAPNAASADAGGMLSQIGKGLGGPHV